jgi:hypothetical protein
LSTIFAIRCVGSGSGSGSGIDYRMQTMAERTSSYKDNNAKGTTTHKYSTQQATINQTSSATGRFARGSISGITGFSLLDADDRQATTLTRWI